MDYLQCYAKTRDSPSTIVHQIIEIIEIYMGHVSRKPLAIAEFGCGTGRIALPLGKIFGTVTCLDKSDESYQILRESALQENIRFRFISADLERDIQVEGGSFDVIILSHVLHWISDFDKLFSNVFKCLSKTGLVLILLYNHATLEEMLFYKIMNSTVLEIQKEITPSLETIERTLHKNGLAVIEIRYFTNTKKYALEDIKSIIEYKGTRALQILYQRFGDERYTEIKTEADRRIEQVFGDKSFLIENEIETLIVCKKSDIK